MAKDHSPPLHVVWFKRDLRGTDHRPLARAAEAGRVLPLYMAEPDLWAEPDMAARHWAFVTESLTELRKDLARLGQPLVVRRGDAVTILEALAREHGMAALWSHEETGNAWSYARDRAVAAWCRAHGVPWHEIPQHGVIRRLGSRDGWARRWDRMMAEPVTAPPALGPLDLDPGSIPDAATLGLASDPCPARQTGGSAAGFERLESFLATRGETYRSAMSTPLEGAEACSRLSPHLAWGTVSMREAAQAAWQAQAHVGSRPRGTVTRWRGALGSFTGRLHWHCHFMQKLEDAPDIEHRNLHRAYDGVRPSAPGPERLGPWARGETGLPFVDACMRSLAATGWLNFRMRAMVMAVASYHLWLDWRAPGLHLARQFTDYEPGIHWPQVQMQSGTTGINTVRIYNPVKQGLDQDPNGVFIRRWVPELAAIDDRFVHEPWKAPDAGAVLGRVYPHPMIDHLAAARAARDAIWAARRGPAFRSEANAIQVKHGSRKSGIPMRGRKRKTAVPAAQGTLPLDLPGETR